EEYLSHCIWLEGRRGLVNSTCRGCLDGNRVACIRCETCFGGHLLCEECTVEQHSRAPFHIIKRWNGHFFVSETLTKIGLRVQLGHVGGGRCPIPHPGHKNFVIIDVTGIHRVALDFCDCQSLPHRVQMIQSELWPSTPLEPQTGATFAVLKLFHRL
ncbi:hypothetical protein BV25DRAFT_1771787, partial [Artomyces pyxidatus]